jgi:purine-binding chemotaxis protein CheW
MTTTSQSTAAASKAKAIAGKYLTFTLGDECYGVAVLKVREIIKLVAVTPVPQMPSDVKGVINLRGKIIPVLDLRVKFGMPEAERTDRTCIIVVQVARGAQSSIALGLVVDSVEEVLNISENDIEETPDFGMAVNSAYMLGMAKIKGAVKTLLDIDSVLGGDSLSTF